MEYCPGTVVVIVYSLEKSEEEHDRRMWWSALTLMALCELEEEEDFQLSIDDPVDVHGLVSLWILAPAFLTSPVVLQQGGVMKERHVLLQFSLVAASFALLPLVHM